MTVQMTRKEAQEWLKQGDPKSGFLSIHVRALLEAYLGATKYGTPEEIVACALETVRGKWVSSERVAAPPWLFGGYLDKQAHKDVVEALTKRAEGKKDD